MSEPVRRPMMSRPSIPTGSAVYNSNRWKTSRFFHEPASGAQFGARETLQLQGAQLTKRFLFFSATQLYFALSINFK